MIKRRIVKLQKKLENLEKNRERIIQDISGMRRIIKENKFPSQQNVNIGIFYKLERNLLENQREQERVLEKMKKKFILF